MFVRTKVFRNKDGSTRTYLQLVAGERVGDKVRQKVIANLGRLEQLQETTLDGLIEALMRFSTRQWVITQARDLKAKYAKSWGPALIFGRLWEDLGLDGILRRLVDATEIESDFTEAVFAMVLNRICDPMSRLATSEWVSTVYRPGWEGMSLHHFYRALDFLADHKDEIEKRLYARSRDLFSLKVDPVLWDTTTTYFCGRACEGLAEYGFSKDKRPDRLRIMVGVLMTADGFPIAHEVFPGNTVEEATSRLAIKKVQRQFDLGRVILVADRGMVSEALLRESEDARLEYIIGVRMRRAKAVREVLSRAGRYSAVAEDLMVKEVVHEGIRYVLRTNASLKPAEVVASYKSLWQVEGAFRELKSGLGLSLRPAYHFTDKRIRGHVAVCFLALVLESALRRKLKELGDDNLRYDELLLHLDQLKAVELVLDDTSYLVRTELAGQAALAFKALGMRPPPRATELPRQAANPPDECCGMRDSCASNPNNGKDFHA